MKIFRRVAAFAVSALLAVAAFAQTYPYSSPTFTPTAILAPATLSAPGDYTFAVSGVSTVTFNVTGTCTSLAATPQGTNDGTNWSTIQLIPVAGGALVTSISGTGTWRANAAGLTRVRLHVTALTASCRFAAAGSPTPGALYLMNPNTAVNPTSLTDSTGAYNWVVDSSGNGAVKLVAGTAIAGKFGIDQTTDGTTNKVSITQLATTGDPCQNTSILKSSAVINLGSSVTTNIVDTNASKVIYVCQIALSATGTNPTVTVKTGTKVTNDCDTSTASLSGAITPSATQGMVNLGGAGHTLLKSIAGGQLCLTTGATTSAQGVLTYVQQ